MNSQERRREDPSHMDHCFLSPKDLADRWSCSRTAAQRIAERAGIARFVLGEGRNGMVRYRLDEVEAYERTRRMAVSTP